MHENCIELAICTNVLRLAYRLGRDEEVVSTENFVYECLDYKMYDNCCYYFDSMFMFYLARALKFSDQAMKRFRKKLLKCVFECSKSQIEYVIDIACRLMVYKLLNVENEFVEHERQK
ncbi:7897_t:CDS:1 [Dentiscutata erythropus]|uniref:7897_t:CDS:1 n=1 Tax=Dentiscutata erythropus TaxID=1348616 RepID=A0A9N9CEH7_9GLOM|nr:7897_t:CDS:1 [Dentiscutata erythropus]